MASIAPLPVDLVLPALVDALSRTGRVVLEAPPGAGKTTRVPPAILGALPASGQVWVLEPRRLAARTAARRVAEELGTSVGAIVGYRVRFDDQTTDRTRIVFATEGVLLERLRRDPTLRGIDAIVFDEFHERHLDGDVILGLGLALARTRPLWLCVMSATLDAAPIAAYLGATRITSEGRRFPIEIRYAPPQPFEGREEPLERSVARAARACLVEGTGDVLVFLPGAREIRAAERALGERGDVDVVPLHGDLAPEAQDRAIRKGARQKIILSTNVAETSVTIEGVSAVVDSGLARVASHSPWTGLPALAVRRVSRASTAQRAGRAGRLGPGLCVRLYSQHDHDARPEHERPEVERADLADTRLLFADQGLDPATFDWLTPPPELSLSAAETLLERLGALEHGGITDVGRKLARMPVHPRAARLLLAAAERGASEGGALVAAILGQGGDRGGSRRKHDVDGPADLLEEMEAIRRARRGDRVDFDRARHEGLDAGRLAEIDRTRKQLVRHASQSVRALRAGSVEEERALLRALLAAFPDRVAKRLKAHGPDIAFAEGGSGKLDPQSVVRSAELLIAYDVTERSGQVAGGRPADGVVVRGAAAIEADWLLEDQLDLIVDEIRYEWNRGAERVDEVRALRYGIVSIEETRAPARTTDDADVRAKIAAVLGAALAESLRTGGGRLSELRQHLGRALDRLAFLATALPELGLPEPPRLEETSGDALRALFASAVDGATRFDEVANMSAHALVTAQLPPQVAARFDRDAPDAIVLGGRRTKVEYPRGQPPYIASRLQDFFGMSDGPKLAGRVALTLHLLAPNKRAVQVTQDLAGFWERHYPAIRKELGRRYPRHKWPEDPLRPDVIS